jgi:pseudouridine-5'-phosphate glycosidase
LPAFYSRNSGLGLELRANNPADIAAVASTHWQLGCRSAVLVAQPVPVELEVPAEEIQLAIDRALDAAAATGVAGKEVTPFLLSRVVELTGGRALIANIALLRQNARLAGEIARALTEVEVVCESEGDSVSV